MTIGQLKKERTFLDSEAQMTYEHLSVISKEIHESGSEDCHAVKDYIVEVLNNIGCNYHIQSFDISVRTIVEKLIEKDIAYYKTHQEEKKSWDDFAFRQGYSDFLTFIQEKGVEWYANEHYNTPADYIFSENNILIKFDAAATDDAVLFVAHYDSAGVSYGAGDNGLSCAALLTAASILQEKYITNDIYILFTDGEEMGLLGANHFVEENDELLNNVKLVIDIEGGANGAYQLLRTTGSNSGMITETDRALSNFTYYSALDGAFSYMGLYTDLSSFTDQGLIGMDFMRMEMIEVYHTPEDKIENISNATINETLDSVTELLNYYSTSDLNKLSADESVNAFPITNTSTVVINNKILIILLCCGIFGILAILITNMKEKRISIKNTAIAIGFIVLTEVCGFIISYVIAVRHESRYSSLAKVKETIKDTSFIECGNQSLVLFYIITSILAFVVATWCFCFFKKQDITKQVIGLYLTFNMIFSFISCFTFTGSMYLFVLPMLFLIIDEAWGEKYRSIRLIVTIIQLVLVSLINMSLIWVLYIGLHQFLLVWTIPVTILITILTIIYLTAISIRAAKQL